MHELLKKVAITFLIRGIGTVSGFLLTLAITRNMLTHEAGLFLFCLTLVNAFGMHLTIGGYDACLKIVGANSVDNREFVAQSINQILTYIIFIGLFSILSIIIFRQQISILLTNETLLSPLLPLVGVSALGFAVIQIFSSLHQGMNRTVSASLIQTILYQSLFLFLFYIAIFASRSMTVRTALFILVIAIAITSVAALIFRPQVAKNVFRFDFSMNEELKSSLLPLFTILIMIQCAQWASQLAAAKFLPIEQVAYLSAAQRTALLGSFVLLAVNLVVAPRFADAFKRNDLEEVNSLSLHSGRLMVVTALPILVLMLIFPGRIMSLFGEEYSVAAPLLRILAIGQFINTTTGSVGYLLNMTNHERDLRNIVLFVGPLAIVLSLTLTPILGLTGAAIATAIVVSVQNLAGAWYVKKRLGFNTLNVFRKI